MKPRIYIEQREDGRLQVVAHWAAAADAGEYETVLGDCPGEMVEWLRDALESHGIEVAA